MRRRSTSQCRPSENSSRSWTRISSPDPGNRTNTIQDLLQTQACPICGQSAVEEIFPSAYPAGLTREQLLKVYSSSSDECLMDRLVRCPECDVAFTSPRVIDAVIGASYADAVDPVFVAQDELRISTFRRNFRRIIADVGVAADRSKKILDVGCAGGAFVRAAQDLGFTSTGIEPSRWLAERARTQNGLDVRPGILSDHSFPGKSFTFISLWDVIEHLTNPGAVLDDIHRLLADDGFLIVNWPDYGSLVRKVLGRKWPFFLNVHLFYFTPSSMRALLRNHGFEPVSIRPYFQTLEFGYALDRAVRIFPFFSPLVRLAKRLGVSRFPLRYNAGQSLMVARKKSR